MSDGDATPRGARFGLTTRLRLTVLYTSISILSVVAIFGLTFLSLYRTLQQDDLRDMQSRLLGYWAQFQTGGLDLLREEIGVDNLLVGERPFFVRVADKDNNTVFFSYPTVRKLDVFLGGLDVSEAETLTAVRNVQHGSASSGQCGVVGTSLTWPFQ